MGSIFLNYRRVDSAGEAGRLSDDLTVRFGRGVIFMDVDAIQPGLDFRTAIHENVGSCKILLALIGPSWLGCEDDSGLKRLCSTTDHVRLEIATALQRGIPVVPILVRGARMPKADQLPQEIQDLAFRHSIELTHARWKSDVQAMADSLASLLQEPVKPELPTEAKHAPLVPMAKHSPLVPMIASFWHKVRLVCSVALALAVVVGATSWLSTRGEEILRLEGSTSVGDKLAPALAAEFLSKELHAESVTTKVTSATAADGSKYQVFEVSGRVGLRRQMIHIVSNGSGKAFPALSNQTADLGMSSRPYSDSDPADLDYLPASNSNEHVIALDGIAVIVNSANRVQTLSLLQLKSIFTGQVTSWGQVNGSGGRIHCYGRDSASGVYEMFRNKVVGKGGTLTAIGSGDQFADGKALVEKIASDPDGIGYVTFTQANGVRSVAVSDQGTTAMYPNSLTVSTEDYVLTRRLYLYQPRDASKVAGDFVTFAQSQEGQSVVSSKGFVSLMPRVHDEPAMPDAPEDYRAAVNGLGRLGVSFRFTSGNGSLGGNNGYSLDSLAQDNLLRLKSYMEQHPNDELVLLGFTDSQRSPLKSNKELGTERAQSVADELMRSGIPTRVYGLGDEMAVASNLTPDGRAKNRRVEVWVRSGR